MEFQEIFVDRVIVIALVSGISVIAGAFLALLALFGHHARDKGSNSLRIVFAASSVVLVITGLALVSTSNNLTDSNREALVSNIEQKYDVDEVVLSGVDVSTQSDRASAQPVNIVVDGSTYTFHLTQDKNTWEPTLTNPPASGGSSTTEHLSAEDLLKTSN